MDAASSQSGDLLPLSSAEESAPAPPSTSLSGLPRNLIQELWVAAEGDTCDLALEEFRIALASVGEKFNYGVAPGSHADSAQKTAFFRSLRLSELALAHSCALGREVAWQRFVSLYRSQLTQAAVAIAGSATLGHDLADSLYSELYGLRQVDGQRRSPLSSYSGRGSLLGWLRTTLAQRHVDHHRRVHRETPLDSLDVPASEPAHSTVPAELARLTGAVAQTLRELPPEDRFLLSSYFLDRQTLLQIAHILHVHEATISRKLKRLTADLREQLLRNLRAGGLSKRGAEEALGADPRDIEINLRALLQTSQTASFSNKTASPVTAASDQP